MPNPLVIADATDLVDPAIQKIWLKGSEKESADYKTFMNVETGVTDFDLKDSSLSGLGYASRIVTNALIKSQSPIQGNDQTYTQVNYGIIFSVEKKMWFFGIKKRDLTRVSSEARNACADLRELRCAERVDNMFETSYVAVDEEGDYTVTTTGGAGVAAISNAITREDGGTNINNRITDGTTINMDFDYDAIKALHRTASLVRNLRGKPMNITPDTIQFVRGTTGFFRAMEILGAIKRDKLPGEISNDGSGVMAFKVLATPWRLANTAFWFAWDSKMMSDKWGFQYKESQGISLDGPNIVFKTEEIQYRATLMFDIGFNDMRIGFGSKDTNAS